MTTHKRTAADSDRGGYNYMTLADEWALVDKSHEWMEQGACRGMDTLLWFPEQGHAHKVAQAKKVCGLCPVRKKCFEWANTNHIFEGIWGGKTPVERKRYLNYKI